MPTGYTADIPNQTFEQFVIACARGMGACISMRDDPADAEIPERFEPSDYHAKALEKAQKRLEELNEMSAEDVALAAAADFDSRVDHYIKRRDENRERIKAYRAMLENVKAWEPPTDDHKEFKKFMVDQIEKSIEWDDMSDHDSTPVRLTGGQWKAEQIKSACRDISYHAEHHQLEIDRTESRNQWIAKLRESLAGQP